MRPCGDSMKTRTPFLPRIAYSAAEPGVARGGAEDVDLFAAFFPARTRTGCRAAAWPCRLKASVGPFEVRAGPSFPWLLLQPMHRRDLGGVVAGAGIYRSTPRRCRSCRRSTSGRRRNVVDELRQDGEGQFGVGGCARHRARHASPADTIRAGRGRHPAPGRRAGCRRRIGSANCRGSRDSMAVTERQFRVSRKGAILPRGRRAQGNYKVEAKRSAAKRATDRMAKQEIHGYKFSDAGSPARKAMRASAEGTSRAASRLRASDVGPENAIPATTCDRAPVTSGSRKRRTRPAPFRRLLPATRARQHRQTAARHKRQAPPQ